VFPACFTFGAMFCSLIAVVATLVGGLQIIYLIAGLRALAGFKQDTVPEIPENPAVSVIICARNEAHNLALRLPAILAQSYPQFEVLVADDGSEDATPAVLAGLQQRFLNLRFRKIDAAEKPFPGKKGALQVAVAEAAHDILLFTDADCLPASPYWIGEMTAALSKEKEIVVGYGPYEKTSGFLNLFIRAETLWSFSQVKAFFRFGVVYMAVGRNLCVRKSTFLRASRHPIWNKTLSGDDDMLMRICATKQNTAILGRAETKMASPAKDTWKSYRHQKQRHFSTGKYYRWPVKMLLAGLSGSHTLSWLLLPFVIFCFLKSPTLLVQAALGIFGLRTLLFYAVFYRQSRREKDPFPVWAPLVFDVALALYPIFFAPYIFWKNKDQWK